MTDENKPVEDLTGRPDPGRAGSGRPRVVVVTGASSGVGAAAAEDFARRGDHVVLVGRDPGRLAAAAGRVGAVATDEPAVFRADFAVLDEVRTLAAALRDRYPHIDVLANNAGALVPRRDITVDGFERTIQTNHLAGFLLAHLLRDRLRGGRVITTASAVHTQGRLDPDDLNAAGRAYGAMAAYSASKRANVLFAAEAARRWPDILSTSFHPGVVRTRFGSEAPLVALFYRVSPFLLSPARGADTLVWLGDADPARLNNGGYYVKRRPRGPAPAVADPRLADRLWTASLAAVGLP